MSTGPTRRIHHRTDHTCAAASSIPADSFSSEKRWQHCRDGKAWGPHANRYQRFGDVQGGGAHEPPDECAVGPAAIWYDTAAIAAPAARKALTPNRTLNAVRRRLRAISRCESLPNSPSGQGCQPRLEEDVIGPPPASRAHGPVRAAREHPSPRFRPRVGPVSPRGSAVSEFRSGLLALGDRAWQ